MATSRNNVIHQRQGKSKFQSIKDRIDYAINGAKTLNGELVTAYECDPQHAAEEMYFSKLEYFDNTGRDQGDSDILLYHVRQSFKPGEVIVNLEATSNGKSLEKVNFEIAHQLEGTIDLEMANKIGHDLAMGFTGGNHQFIVATHIDTAHIHNAIIINSVNLSCDGKFRNEIGSYKRLRAISDELCAKYGLSIIKKPDFSHGFGHGTKPVEGQKEPTARQKVMVLIDEIIEKHKPNNLDELVTQLKKSNCKVKIGKHISIKLPNQKRYIRLRSLPEDYKEENLQNRLAKSRAINHIPIDNLPQKKINLLIDIENSLKAQNSPGYKNWSKVFNLQQAAETLLYLPKHNIMDLETLRETANKAQLDYNIVNTRIQSIDDRLKDISTLQKHIGAYRKTKDVYSQYLKSKRNKTFFENNKNAIETCKVAKTRFDALGLDKIPSIKELQQEYATLNAEKKTCYAQRKNLQKHMNDMQTAKKNTEILLGYRNVEDSKKAPEPTFKNSSRLQDER